jgi:phytoene dehydrogenase-like protein
VTTKTYDAVVVGSGPNGLAAAVTLAREGLRVAVFEGAPAIGGGTRSDELTLPGFTHDVCSTVHPLALASPLFRSLPLEAHGLRWIHPDSPLAHPLDDQPAVLVERDLDLTAAHLGADGERYHRLMAPFMQSWRGLMYDLLGPLRIPKHPFTLARFGLRAVRSASALAQSAFQGPRARALLAGHAAHAMLPLQKAGTAAFWLMLGLLCHAVGWPVAAGGSQQIANALASYLLSLDGDIFVNRYVASMHDLPSHGALLLDVTPKQALEIAGEILPTSYRMALRRFRYGLGVFKIDWALNGLVPWRDEACARAATVHLGGTLEEIRACEQAVWEGNLPASPFVILAQQTSFDPSRAPGGKHTAWAYCHVPNGSNADMTDRIEAQVERFAPGFRDLILAKRTMTATQIQAYNPNYIGGDINGGVQDLRQQFARPAARIDPYATPVRGLYLCSSSTPPGGGVHGMCGFHAAQSALKHLSR